MSIGAYLAGTAGQHGEVGDNGMLVNMDEALHAVAFSPAVAPLVRQTTPLVGSRRRVSTPSSRTGARECSVGVGSRGLVFSQVPMSREVSGVGKVLPGSNFTRPRYLGSILLAQSSN